ncbi:hypothetical protein [Azospirillum thermophilum]|uniref:Uncharacterized protein n=1 Tax=Azospirillum thermophilum TaxID=2202148 RepID=A0A2S2CK92_9PROT|nr:hypothetical protein [Azospirillum thermophilum]AWK84928.1 hypothetical protein DEW08_00905 [Azospirillum thermophilum]
MMNKTLVALFATAALVVGLADHGPAFAAAGTPSNTGTTSAGGSAAPAKEDGAKPVPATVEGFRSAKFGMGEEDLRKAIRADFGVKDTDIERAENPVERTTALSVTVKDLLPGGGPARVSYILGYATKKLIHVNVLWARDLGDTPNETLLANASTLQAYLSEQPFQPDNVAMNAPLPDGSVLLFRGSDARSRVVLLTVSGLARQAEPGKKPGAKGAGKEAEDRPVIRLSYIANPAEPDIFRVKPGQF